MTHLPALTALLEQAVKSGDPNGLPALAEWVALVHGIAEITHIFNHLEPDVIAAAQQAAKACIESQGDEATPLH